MRNKLTVQINIHKYNIFGLQRLIKKNNLISLQIKVKIQLPYTHALAQSSYKYMIRSYIKITNRFLKINQHHIQ